MSELAMTEEIGVSLDEPIHDLTTLGELCSRELARGTPLYRLKPYLSRYDGSDWKGRCYCPSKYQRHQLYCDDQVEILVLCWSEHQASGVHDHPENGCLVRVMCGSLQEDCYHWGSEEQPDLSTPSRERTLSIGGISYQQGKKGLHNIRNLEDQKACTIHVYSPPCYHPTFYE